MRVVCTILWIALPGAAQAALPGLFAPAAPGQARQILWVDVWAAAAILLAASLISALISWILRRQKSRAGGLAESARDVRGQLLQAVSKPLQLLAWVWSLSAASALTIGKLPALGQEGSVPQLFRRLAELGLFAAGFWLCYRLTYVLEARLLAWTERSSSKLDNLLVPFLGKSLRVIGPVIAIVLLLPALAIPPAYSGILSKASSLLIVGAVSYLLFQSVAAAEKVVLARFDIREADNLQARKVYTQMHVLSKALYVLISIFTAASVLMLFEEVRRFGTSILASAGVVGIIIGFAAQRTITNLFAGFQLAMTQPIRLDDVVIVESEWGRIEEITLTYVVVRIWDERRLIVPLSYFIEKPFQNWTRVSANLLGSVFLYADYTVPLDELRRETQRIVENHPLWDRKFWNLQVTDATDRALQLRVLATAADSGKAWTLRCEIREKLIEYLQKNHPESLPRLRAEWEQRSSPSAPALHGQVQDQAGPVGAGRSDS